MHISGRPSTEFMLREKSYQIFTRSRLPQASSSRQRISTTRCWGIKKGSAQWMMRLERLGADTTYRSRPSAGSSRTSIDYSLNHRSITVTTCLSSAGPSGGLFCNGVPFRETAWWEYVAFPDRQAPTKSAKKPRKVTAGQKEMLMPIAGKGEGKKAAAKEPKRPRASRDRKAG
jgi:hypothetical protein